MKSNREHIIYSESVREIITDPPRRIIRWGTSIISLVIILLVAISWIIKYPDIIPSAIEITTRIPPATMVSKVSGRINMIFVENGQLVEKGDILAVMETSASVSQIEDLRNILDTANQAHFQKPAYLSSFNRLGELQPEFTTFLKRLTDYDSYIRNDLYGSKVRAVYDEISGIERYLASILVKEELIAQRLLLEEEKYARDSLLNAGRFISESDLERSEQALIAMKLELQQVRLDHASKIIEMAEKRQELQDYTIIRQEEKDKLLSLLNESFLNLKAGMNIWMSKYLLISPLNGSVTFTKYWSENQAVLVNEPVLSVVPAETGEYLGRISLKMNRSGKVFTGQKVNIKLSGYPYLEFGMVRGIVSTKSLVPSENAYIIEITLPQGLTTLYGKELEFTQNMQGIAEIITSDMSLLQKIVNPFRYLASKNSSE